MLNKINRIMYIITVICIVLIAFLITKLNILPIKYYLPIIFILLLWGIGLFFIILKCKKKVISIIVLILMILTVIFNMFCSYYVYNTDRFFNKLSEVSEKELYYVIVKKSSDYTKLSDLKDKKLGLVDTKSSTYNEAFKKLKEEVSVSTHKYNNMNNIVKDLLGDSIDSILISSSNKRILDEVMTGFKSSTRVIKKISVDIKKKANNSNSYGEGNFNILISGIDIAGDINNVSRSDVNIILTVNSKNHEVVLTSVPRDMQVQLHGTTGLKDKLTHAGMYGIDMSRTTLEDFLEVKIDYYIRVNFDSVVNIVNAIGGVDIYNDVAFYRGSRYYAVGNIHLNGKDALGYCRERYAMPSGDWTRGLHQEEVIKGIFNKISTSTELLSNYSEIISSLQSFFQTNIPSDLIKKFVKDQLDGMPVWEVNYYAVGGSGYSYEETYSMPGLKLYVTHPNEEHRKHASKVINSVLKGKKYKDIGW